MICRRCGAELADNTTRCSNCGLRTGLYCPKCNTFNQFGDMTCKNCGFELLSACPVCGGINVYSALECRKCKSKLPLSMQKAEKNQSEGIEVVGAFSSEDAWYLRQELPEKIDDDNILQLPEYKNEAQKQENTEIKDVFRSEDLTEKEKEKINNEPPLNPTAQEAAISEDILNENTCEDTVELEETFDNEVNKSIENDTVSEEMKEKEDDEEPQSGEDIEIQPQAAENIIRILTTSLDKHIIGVNGAEGSGKSAVLKQISRSLADKGFISLQGSCCPISQITSFGFFQDAFLRLMGFPPYTKSADAFFKEFKKSAYAKVFCFLNTNELNLFLNIFYPAFKDNFENILVNKKRMFSVLANVIKSLLVNHNLLISIDNFELLDGASYDFLVYMLKNGFFNNRLKLLAAYKENKSIQSYFEISGAQEKFFETILLKNPGREELVRAVNKSTMIDIETVLDKDYLDEIIRKSDGNAIRLEQETALLFDTGYISLNGNKVVINPENKPDIPPVSFEELIKFRINSLTPAAKNVLFISAVMGYRFSPNILYRALAANAGKTQNILDYLAAELFIQKVDDYTFEFKSLALWKLIYKEAKSDLLYKENSERLYGVLKQLLLSSNLQKLISCIDALNKNEAFAVWQNTAGLCAKLGDTNLYVIAQKQCLKILDEQDVKDGETIKIRIYEEIGKLLCEKSPKEAVTYLSTVLDYYIKEVNLRKAVDISGYFIKSCYLTGNYFGVAEAADSLTKCLNGANINVSELEISLINTRKLKALLNIGNCEQIIGIINEDIINVLERGLNSKQTDSKYKNIIINAWLLSKITLAKACALQGSNQTEKVICEIRQFIEKNEKLENKDYYTAQTDIIDAFSNTVKGNINVSNDILNALASRRKNKITDTGLIAEWNLVHIINRVLTDQYNDLKVDLFELAAFTNNINEYFIKNIIKLILGTVLQKEGNTAKALEIFNEEITYFAKEKAAAGALLSWALIVQIYMETGDDNKALDTAVKSLEIAQSPKINNYFFIIYFQKFLAEIYLRKGDFTAAKMYLEKSVMIAKQYNLKYQLIELYLAYAKYTEELMKSKQIYSSEGVKTVTDMYNKAIETAKELKLPNLTEKASVKYSEFKTFCRLHSIETQ